MAELFRQHRIARLEGSVPSRSAEEVAKEVAHDVLLIVQDESPGEYWIDKCGAVIAPIIQQAMNGARAASIEEAAKVAEWSHMVPPDGGSPSQEEHDVARNAAAAIRALAEQPKESVDA